MGIEILLIFMSPPWLGGIRTKSDVLRMGEETKFLKRRGLRITFVPGLRISTPLG